MRIVDASWPCRRPDGRAARNSWRRISPAPASSTSTRSPTAPTRRRTCCRRRTDFGAAMTELGVGRDDRIIVYDNSPLRTAARGWFMLRHFGADGSRSSTAASRNGVAEGRPVESGEPAPREARFDAVERRGEVVDQGRDPRRPRHAVARRARPRAVRRHRAGPAARASPPATSRARATCRSPSSTARTARSSPTRSSRALFERRGVDPDRPFIASCGSGVTANSLIFAAHRLGGRRQGFTTEAGANGAPTRRRPKATGPA